MNLARASLCALLLAAYPAVAFAQFHELWTADVSLSAVGSAFLNYVDVMDLDGDSQNEMVVNVDCGGVFCVQIRDALTGAVEFTSTTTTPNNFGFWTFYMAELNGSSPPELVATFGGRVLVIGYGGSVAAPAPAAQAIPRDGVLPARPNPFARDVSLFYALVSPGRAEIEVFDVAGRLVRRLGGERAEAGEHRVDWDGRDQEGRTLGPGMYFYRLTVDGRASEARRAVRLGQ